MTSTQRKEYVEISPAAAIEQENLRPSFQKCSEELTLLAPERSQKAWVDFVLPDLCDHLLGHGQLVLGAAVGDQVVPDGHTALLPLPLPYHHACSAAGPHPVDDPALPADDGHVLGGLDDLGGGHQYGGLLGPHGGEG